MREVGICYFTLFQFQIWLALVLVIFILVIYYLYTKLLFLKSEIMIIN